MPRWRLLLLPFGALAELSLLAARYLMAQVDAARLERLMHWSRRRLPDLDWYIGA